MTEINEFEEIIDEEFGEESDSLTEAVDQALALSKEFKRDFAILNDYTIAPADSVRRNVLMVVEYEKE